MTKLLTLNPFMKYPGGKSALIKTIAPYLPTRFDRYAEIFVGGGAMLFHLQPNKAIVNDINREVIDVYEAVRDCPEELIEELKTHRVNNNQDYFYSIRQLDRDSSFLELSKIKKAARKIYLQQTAYNGLSRYNQQNQSNTPYGYYKNPNICQKETIRNISSYLQNKNIKIMCGDFDVAIEEIEPKTFCYLDPPYAPLNETSSFAEYSGEGFTIQHQKRLRKAVDRLTERGCSVMLSNSTAPIIHELYEDYKIITIEAPRRINCKGNKRGKIEELLILNY